MSPTRQASTKSPVPPARASEIHCTAIPSLPTAIDDKTIEASIAEILKIDPLIRAVGIGVPGIVHRGIVSRCDIRALQGVPLVERVQNRFGLATIVENDMNITAYGYYQKHAQELDSLAVVILPKGNGPGTGIIVDGKILRGHSGFPGEVHYLRKNTIRYFGHRPTMRVSFRPWQGCWRQSLPWWIPSGSC